MGERFVVEVRHDPEDTPPMWLGRVRFVTSSSRKRLRQDSTAYGWW